MRKSQLLKERRIIIQALWAMRDEMTLAFGNLKSVAELTDVMNDELYKALKNTLVHLGAGVDIMSNLVEGLDTVREG